MCKLKPLYCSFSHHFWQCTGMKSQTNKKEHNISAIHFAAQEQEAYNAHVCCTSTVWGIFLTSAFFGEDIARWNVLKPWKALCEVVLTYTEKKKKYTEQKKKKKWEESKKENEMSFLSASASTWRQKMTWPDRGSGSVYAFILTQNTMVHLNSGEGHCLQMDF